MMVLQVIGGIALAIVGLGIVGHFLGEWSARNKLPPYPFHDWSPKEDEIVPENEEIRRQA